MLTFLDYKVVAGGMITDYAVNALAGTDGHWIKQSRVPAIVTHHF